MLTVKTALGMSKINGIGLFADEDIPKGTITWKFNPKFDILFDPVEVKKMLEREQKLIDHFSYLSKTTGKYVYSIDDSRFTNHSINNNIDSIPFPGEAEACGVANKDIKKGEEMTANYRTFDKYDETSTEKYLES